MITTQNLRPFSGCIVAYTGPYPTTISPYRLDNNDIRYGTVDSSSDKELLIYEFVDRDNLVPYKPLYGTKYTYISIRAATIEEIDMLYYGILIGNCFHMSLDHNNIIEWNIYKKNVKKFENV